MKKLLVILLAFLAGPVIALDDPTRPPGYALPSSKGGASGPFWHVSAIRIAAKNKSAIVNGRTVSVGNRVDGATVIDIEPTEVTLKKAGKQFSVRLFAHSVKKTTRTPIR